MSTGRAWISRTTTLQLQSGSVAGWGCAVSCRSAQRPALRGSGSASSARSPARMTMRSRCGKFVVVDRRCRTVGLV
eukprot:15448403-Alexandrium_andersonii.AAC.1